MADLAAWVADDGDTSIYWLNGKAGTGKTTIAFTFCQILDNTDILGASFFCSHLDTDSSNADLIFPTLAYELARHSTAASNALLSALEKDRNVGYKSLRDQFLNLIVTPTKVASVGVSTSRPLIIVIDGLDECTDQNDASDVLAIIDEYSPTLPLKFFITSRPERQIQDFFRQEGNSKYILLEIEKGVVSADIAKYPKEKLAITTEGRTAGTPISSETSALDNLLGSVLSAAFQANAREKDEIQKVLRAVISVRTPLSINGLSRLLKIKAENVSEALSSLRMDLPVSTIHASFTDFITSENRSGEYFLDPSESHQMLGLHCLRLLQSSLVENICQLDGLSGSLMDVSPSTIKDRIPEALEYACDNWAYHVVNIKSRKKKVTREVVDALYSFFDEKLLQWFECLSLLNRLGDAVSSLQKLEAWLPVCGCSISVKIMADQQMKGEHNLQSTVIGAMNFIIENFDLLSRHPCEIYNSALVWLPEQSHIRTKYGDNRKSVWNGLWKACDTCEQVLQGHSDKVFSVAFSPDGRHVVSGSNDNTVHIWNVVMGESVAELKGHLGSVYSVVFSPDGSLVASGSRDNTIRIWNVGTSECEAELKGHSGSVNSVVFSPDSMHMASGSRDNTVCIWNVVTSECEAELKGHSDSVNSVAFSPNGSHVASGSRDNTVCIWDVVTGVSVAEMKGHSGSVNSVIFSPDGCSVVSGSADNTVRIWNVAAGECQAELKGHSGSVYSAAFSPDGNLVVSGSADNTVCIWDVVTGVSVAEMKGHLGSVNSVIFSPDGRSVVSGSADNTVCIWNAVMGDSKVPQHLQGTTCWIAAEHALQHVRNNILSITKVFDTWQIQKSEYVILAGFDESLIKSGVGYLEQIHVFVIADVDATSPLLSELGRLFSPFSSTLFTESSSHHLPVFKDDGSVWEFDELVYFTASKFADGGSSAKNPLTIISLSQTTSLADGTTGSSQTQSNSGSGEGEKNKKQRSEKGKERDTGDKEEEADKGYKDNKDPSNNPEENQSGIIAASGPAKISFDIASEIEPESNTFQTLTMHGGLTIEVLLYHFCIIVLPD